MLNSGGAQLPAEAALRRCPDHFLGLEFLLNVLVVTESKFIGEKAEHLVGIRV